MSKALEADPKNAAFLDTMGWIHYKLGNYSQAVEYIEGSLAVRDDSAEVLEHLGDAYEKLGKIDLAIQYWRQAREIEPNRESVLAKLKSTE